MFLADSVGTDLFRAVLQGAPPGTVYALIALGFVLTYKTSGVFNLAFGAQAYVSAVVYYKLHTENDWAIVPAFLIAVVLLAPLIGLLLEGLVFRHLRTAPAVAKLVVTIGLTLALPNLVSLFLDVQSTVPPEGIVPDGGSVFYEVFHTYFFSRNELTQMVVAVVAIVALGALFRYSAIGLRMRAVVESPRMAELNGIASDRVSAVAWALSSFFAGLAGVLIAPKFNTLAAGDFFNLVIVAIAAAAVGRLVSLPRAALGGLGLGILIALFNTFVPKWATTMTWLRPIQDNLTPAIPFIVLFGVLVFDRRLQQTREATDPLSGVDPPPQAVQVVAVDPRRTMIVRIVNTVLISGILLVVFTRADAAWTHRITEAVALATIFLSITVITGMAGQISLCQGTFAAIGAFTTYQLAERWGTSTFTGAFVGALLAAGIAALLSLPLRRLSGIWVAIATLAFAYFFDSVMVKFSWVGGDVSAATVPSPVIGPWDMSADKSLLVLMLIVLALAATAVMQLKAGSIGQKLRALRGSEVAARSIGISPARSRLVAFATSGFLAGLGGALLAIHQGQVNYTNNFTPFGDLFWLVLVVTAGASLVSGAIVGASLFVLFNAVVLQGTFLGWILRDPERIPGIFPIPQQWLFILFGLGTISFARHPEGFIERTRRDLAAKRAEKADRDAGDAPPTAADQTTPETEKVAP